MPKETEKMTEITKIDHKHDAPTGFRGKFSWNRTKIWSFLITKWYFKSKNAMRKTLFSCKIGSFYCKGVIQMIKYLETA